MQIVFYLTPIMYPPQMLLDKLAKSHLEWLINLNPFAVLLELIRQPLLEGQLPSPTLCGDRRRDGAGGRGRRHAGLAAFRKTPDFLPLMKNMPLIQLDDDRTAISGAVLRPDQPEGVSPARLLPPLEKDHLRGPSPGRHQPHRGRRRPAGDHRPQRGGQEHLAETAGRRLSAHGGPPPGQRTDQFVVRHRPGVRARGQRLGKHHVPRLSPGRNPGGRCAPRCSPSPSSASWATFSTCPSATTRPA